MPDAFIDYACGTNGGPPGLPLDGWGDFRRCRPEPSGLREVYFRYDDELEYWARANNLRPQMEQFSGTKTYGFPITVSALIDDDGSVRGIRVVSDPRFEQHNRDEAYLLRNFLTARFGREGWACEKLAAEDGETAVDGIFVKERCRKEIDGAPPRRSRPATCARPGKARSIRAPGGRPLGSSRAWCASSWCGGNSAHLSPHPELSCPLSRRVSGHPVITGQALAECSCHNRTRHASSVFTRFRLSLPGAKPGIARPE